MGFGIKSSLSDFRACAPNHYAAREELNVTELRPCPPGVYHGIGNISEIYGFDNANNPVIKGVQVPGRALQLKSLGIQILLGMPHDCVYVHVKTRNLTERSLP